jgi:hypothetical protein
MVDSAALLLSKNFGGGGQIVILTLTAKKSMRALSAVNDSTGRRRVGEFCSMRFLWYYAIKICKNTVQKNSLTQ